MSDKPWQFIRWQPHPTIPAIDVEPLSPATKPKAERCWLCLGKCDQGAGSPPRSCPCCHGTGEVEVRS